MEENKLPLKRVELSLSKFNEVAIPHHLDLLRQHKANIIKYEDSGDYNRVRSEQTHARRVASQLRSLLGELDSLRRQVREEDCAKFDALTKRSRDLTLRAIMDYLGVIERGCKAIIIKTEQPRPKPSVAGSTTSTESVGVLPQLQLQLEVDSQELELKAREEALEGWRELQTELRALHGVWQTLHLATVEQREQVQAVADNIEVAAENVEVARAHLSYSERLRAGAYGLTGALIGACVAGPVGLTLGAKVAVTAALSASLAGFVGGKMIGHRRQLQLEQESQPQPQTEEETREVKDKDE